MILKLPPNQDVALRKLRLNGLDFDGEVSVEGSGVTLTGVTVEDRFLSSPTVVTVSRNAVLVSLNPAVGEIIGYQPAYSTVLADGFWGQIEAVCGGVDDEQTAQLTALTWFAKLYFVPVQGFS